MSSSGPACRGLFGDVNNWDSNFEPFSIYQAYSSDRPLEQGRRWEHAEFDRAYQAAKQEPDDQKRAARWRQAARILHDKAIALFLWRAGKPAAFARDITWQPGYVADALVGGLKRG